LSGDAAYGVGYNHGYAPEHMIGCKRRQPTILIIRPEVFDRHVLVFDIAGFLQALEKRDGPDLGQVIRGLIAEDPDHRHSRLLPRRHYWPRHRTPEPPSR
jgi:hypothetical protein